MKTRLIIILLFAVQLAMAQKNLFNIYEIGKGEILKKDYAYIEYLYDDLLSALPVVEGVENYNWTNYTGVIDFEENVILPFKYRNIRRLNVGKIINMDNHKKYQYVSVSSGKTSTIFNLKRDVFEEIPFSEGGFHYFSPYNEDIILVGEYLFGSAIINTAKKKSIQLKEINKITGVLNKNLLIYNKEKKEGIIDIEGNIILPAMFKDIRRIDEFIRIEKGDSIGVFNQDLEIVIPPIFNRIEKGKNRFFVTTFNDDKNLSIKSDAIKKYFSDWEAILNTKPNKLYGLSDKEIQQIGLTGAFDLQGNLIIPFEYDYMQKGIDTEIIASKNNDLGVISENGEVLIPFLYNNIEKSFDKFYVVTNTSKKKWAFWK